MSYKVGTSSGYHEQRQHGWPRKSRIWNGDAWVTEEEFKNDKRINLKTNDLYRGTRFVESAKGVLDKTRETLTGVYDTIGSVLPENNIASVTFDEAENLSKGLLSTAASTAVSAYGTLPEGIRENVQAGGSALAQTLDDSRTGWSQQLDLHPVLTDVAFGVGEAVLTTGAGPTAKFLSKTPELVNAARMTQSNRLLLNTVDVNQGLLGGAVRRNAPSLAEISAQPLKSVSGANPQNIVRGSERVAGLKTLVEADPPIKDIEGFIQTGKKELIETKAQKIERYLEQGDSQYLKSQYKNPQSGYWTAKKLSKNPKLLNKVIKKHEEVTVLFDKWKALKNRGASSKQISDAQRELYDKLGENFFNESALIYGTHPLGKAARKKLVETSQWFSNDHWHHIFGNKEIGEFLLTEAAQDPLIAVNLFKHMKKRGLTSSGVADNILIMKQTGHNNFHEFLKKIGIQERYGRPAPGNFESYGQEISKVMRGEAKAAKTFTTETGEVIQKGTRYAQDPEAVNELFTMIDVYAKQNEFIRQKFKEGAITVMEPTGSKGLRTVVPNGYKAKKGESVFVFDLTANIDKSGVKRKSQLPEVYSKKVKNIQDIVTKYSK